MNFIFIYGIVFRYIWHALLLMFIIDSVPSYTDGHQSKRLRECQSEGHTCSHVQPHVTHLAKFT